MPASLKERLEHFELQRELGRGATAKIYLARNLQTDEMVSLKIFHPKMFHDGLFAQRVQREIALSASLRHDNIVRVREVITHSDPPALVMDYVDGANLEKFQSRLPYILPEISALIVVEILKGLEYAHDKGLIHRDLKPENVLVDNCGRVFVTDFGLAKQADSSLITQTNVILGSIDYMSPEQSHGDTVTNASDLFSVAVILYFLTTGTRPFSRETTIATLQAIRAEEPESPTKRNPKISAELSRIISKGLAKDPAARYASAKAFRECLEQYLLTLGFSTETFGITHWIKDPTGMTMEGLRITVEHLTKSCELALEHKRRGLFLETLSHLTLKAPQSPAIARMSKQYRASIEANRRPVYLSLLFMALLIGPCSYWVLQKYHRAADTVAVPPPVQDTPSIFAAVNPSTEASNSNRGNGPVKEKRQPISTGATVPKTTPASTGTVHFNIEPGVEVLWDGRAIDASVPLTNQKPGVHQLTLISAGFEPIHGKVLVKEHEPTVVNAR